MPQFFMSGKAITSSLRFREYFSPLELLRQRELAAGFLEQHFSYLDTVCGIHTNWFYLGALSDAELYFRKPEDYEMIWNLKYLGTIKKEEWRTHLHQPEQQELMNGLWDLAQDTELDKIEKEKLFCILMAGYSLAGKSLITHPLDKKCVEAAYKRQKEEETETWRVFEDNGDIYLEAREEPYQILMKEGAQKLLQGGENITTRKIIAKPHAQGVHGISAKLHLKTSLKDSEPEVIELLAGEYCYANFVGNVLVYLHPTIQFGKKGKLERKGDKLLFTNWQNETKVLPDKAQDIIGFAVEDRGTGYLLIKKDYLDTGAYSLQYTRTVMKQNIVQVLFRESECLELRNDGNVYSDLKKQWFGVRVTDLETFCQEQEE